MKKLKYILVFLFVSAFAKAQQLQSYIKEAEANNPEIQAFELRYNIAEEKVNEANWIPNTEVSAGYFVSEPETRVGAQRARIGVKQMLPWFGTITARENYATAMADAEYVDITIAKRKLALSVAQSYYSLYSIRAKQAVLDENIQLLQTYEQLALTSVEVGKASAVDVLRLQIRQNELQQQKEVLEEEFTAEQTAFNNLLNRESMMTVDVVPEMEIPQEDPFYDNEALALNPELLKYDKLYESVAQSELLNQRESLPMIGFGVDYLPVTERSDVNFSDNGKDVLMPMVSISIPIFNSRYKSISKQNELRQQEIETQREQRLNVLESAFAKAQSQRNQARIAYYTQERNLKQAQDAEEILVKNYETGTIDFNDVLDIQELQLKFQMNQIESVQMYYVQSAIINYLIN
ncbi:MULTISPECIES: TolC family protein [Croceibacter]|jgi:cobalt-zinc-cadmium efflux system outer membrane protein|uniref:Metal ion efflux outer membrane protein family protein, putative n=1 Tax=Croceibacter atlanticus (strain ATCC BAA-628 / JCM 21780 / CIP 108009 / IAM 15332 / KCTC 12090 / HTCC2559) TaxID=216432 RepID=A3UA73_CROAH|nr:MULTISPECIES: TolC family protein [Croceibacter]EAP86709.1 metal ion efflux outer membrane protein family protein, putative [Croceibacter atlanticus HTCC2559]MBG25119.1 TolC family protein [Croceibacter sp.]|tara:strand:+ start:37912 stop:39129 length:1218 start_codon:yes stop_codon:yes gene_type:complete